MAKNKTLYHCTGKTGEKISFAGYSGGQQVRKRITAGTTFRDVEPGISVREDYSFQDYERYRPSNTIPKDVQKIMELGNKAYYKVGIVRNVIDMMSDFATKGVRPAHKSVRINKLYQEWWKKIKGKEISERFINTLYRLGNVIIKRTNGKINTKQLEAWKKYRSTGNKHFTKSATHEIPFEYTFLDPTTLEVIDSEALSVYTKNIRLGIRVDNETLKELIKAGVVDGSKVSKINGSSESLIPLDMSQIARYYYKKDDWQLWAYPMTFAIMDNLLMVEALRQADRAALDGAIAHVRLWTLGDLEHKIIPKDAAIDKLSDILCNAGGGGPIDIIWGPDIKLTETSTEVYKFLGMEKYVPHISAIREGLGVPESLTGGDSGGSNNFVSLRTITERLSYGRELLQAFWAYEFALFADAVGINDPAELIYDRMNLGDVAAEQAIALQMYDRNIISEEAVQLLVGENPEIERARIKRNEKMRAAEKLPRKAGPWNNPEHKEALEKVALQKGVLLPKDVGLESTVPNATLIDMIKPKPAVQKGIPQQGRPKNSKDKSKRKKKPLTGEIEKWAEGALVVINKHIDSLAPGASPEEVAKVKLHILNSFEPFTKVTATLINSALALPVVNGPEMDLFDELLKTGKYEVGQIITKVYSTYKTGDSNG